MVTSPAFVGVVLEEWDAAGGSHVVGAAGSAALKESFALEETVHPRPGLMARVLEAEAVGSSVLMSRAEIGWANEADGVSAALLFARWGQGASATVDPKDMLRVAMGAYALLHARFLLKRVLFEVHDAQSWKMYETVKQLCRTVAHESGSGAPEGHLAMIDRRSNLAATPLGQLYRPGRREMRLSQADQDLLLAYFEVEQQTRRWEYDSRAAATLMGITESTLRRRWGQLYEHVERAAPTVFGPPARTGPTGRYSERRNDIVSHLRRPGNLKELRWPPMRDREEG
jgi:hypothetical protein